MTIRVALHHHTAYRFDRAVALSPHVLRLRPAPHARTPIQSYALKVSPAEHFINWQQDPFGNYLARLVFPEAATELVIDVDLVADMVVINPFDFFLEDSANQFPFTYAADLKKSLAPYLECEKPGPLLRKWLAGVERRPRATIDALVELNQRVWQDVAYDVRMEPGVQAPEETLRLKVGSCRDSGWLLVQILRNSGLAARFASGYLVQLKADQKSLDGPSGPEADFTDLHAWAEVYLPGAGWVGLDPTSGLFAGEGHIPLACTPNPSSAAPVDGFTDPCEVSFSYRNTVQRIHEDPRVTKPYDAHTWAVIDALGRQVDTELQKNDVRLTMGGEPTFISIDDSASAQWNTEADGAHKRQLAEDVLRRLRQAFAAGGVLHYGQGKWYPGEPLPRWAKTCYWRRDGVAIWQDERWLASPDRPLGHGLIEAQRFVDALLAGLGIEGRFLLPAWEDAFHILWEKAQLPTDLDPAKLDQDDRAALARIESALSQSVGEPKGFVLPIEFDAWQQCFRVSPWPLRRQRLILQPGDSPIGYRLPLKSLSWYPEVSDQPPDPMGQRQSIFPNYKALDWRETTGAGTARSPVTNTSRARAPTQVATDRVVRTALCVEVRHEVVHVFLPPLASAEAWLNLLTELEAAARSSGVAIVIEGYEPPFDVRLRRFSVTPDPGVIEINIHPVGDWNELVATTETLYAQARAARLATEKFLIDGRHTGTGGGNHVTLGGATPVHSPLLRRPQLLRSLIAFWQNHPGLSYLFSGLFVGPTSQAPRVDEARDDRLQDLELAFQQLPEGDCDQPWLVDRVLRHLLTDLTGNTHRSEFCIDKLYSPDSASGRLGLLEFRGFEMPPHPHMSLVQMLWLRVLTSWFWQQPYRRPLIRWGSLLHDQFMLPHFVWRDVVDAVLKVNEAGYAFDARWFDSFLEFRFPVYGRVRYQDIQLELRAAIEPWNVLGEEVVSGGTARFVDSSVERLQVKVNGISSERYVVACNGRRLPLHGTGSDGEYVAGVRFQAWQPPSSLHPTIAPQVPLIFDLIDTWNGRAVAGCTYHVSHAGGRHFERPPVNAFEAESRRFGRFWGIGHQTGSLPVPMAVQRLTQFTPHSQLPRPMAPPTEDSSDTGLRYTLDLRRAPRY